MKDAQRSLLFPLFRSRYPLFHKMVPLLIALLLLVNSTVTALATALPRPVRQDSSDFVVTITANRLNVRSAPGVDTAVVAKLFFGNQIHVEEQDATGSWYRVILADGVEGWIAADFAERVDGTVAVSGKLVPATSFTESPTTVEAAPVIEAVAALAAESAPVESAESAVAAVTVPTAYTIPANINIRRGPGTNYPVVTSVSVGTALPIRALNPSGDWYQVQLDSEEEPVWVYASLTTAAGPLETVTRLSADAIPAPPEPVAVAATTASAAPQSAAPQTAAPPPSGGGFFGYGIQVNTWQGDIGGSANMVRDIGFSWAKQQVRWEFVENEPGAVNWNEMDQIVDVMNGNGIQLLFSIVTAPQWTRPDKPGTGGPPNDFNLYANFVGAVAGRYCGRLQAIEVWNEQNLQREWEGFPLDPALYMDLLRRAYGSIKAACPSIIVVSGATTPTGNSPVAVDDIDYLRGMYNNGLAGASDAIGVHPSGYGQPPNVTIQDWQAGSYNAPSHVNHRSFYFRSTMDESRNVMVQYGDVNKRLWPTEFGWASSQSPHPGYEYSAYNSAQQQAQYTVEAYTMMRNWGWVGVPFLWNLNYNTGEMAQWSIIGKPAYDALKGMGK